MSDELAGKFVGLELEDLKKQLEAKREASRRAYDAAAKAVEVERLKDAIAAEDALQAAREKYGLDRAVLVDVRGAGSVVVHWPDKQQWWAFQNRGGLKANGLTAELCEQLVTHSLDYPSLERYKEYSARAPNISIQVAGVIVTAMVADKDDEGKG